jgi:hypothetical protein
MMMGWSEDEMLEGYRDGRNPDSPEPSKNRSRTYRHGFQSGRDDLTRKPSAPAEVRRKMAEEAIEADANQQSAFITTGDNR